MRVGVHLVGKACCVAVRVIDIVLEAIAVVVLVVVLVVGPAISSLVVSVDLWLSPKEAP